MASHPACCHDKVGHGTTPRTGNVHRSIIVQPRIISRTITTAGVNLLKDTTGIM